MIFLFASVLDWPWGLANVAAVAIGTGPTYLMSRRWVWRKDGKSSL
jgi:putative flippase GtrA